MGSGQSLYVQKQEAFVRQNREAFKKELKGYTRGQIDGKLRQLYAGTDNSKENARSYINSTTWNNARSKVRITR
jgi:acylphosphatase